MRALWDLAEPRAALDTLRHSALITLAPEPSWYQQHSLLRAYGKALLTADADERTAVDERYADQVAGIAERFGVLAHEHWDALEPYVPHVEEAGAHIVASATRALGQPGSEARAVARGLAFAPSTRHLLAAAPSSAVPNGSSWGSRYAGGAATSATRSRSWASSASTCSSAVMRLRMVRFDEAADAARRLATAPVRAGPGSCSGWRFCTRTPRSRSAFLHEAAEAFEQLGDQPGLIAARLRMAEWSALAVHDVARREDGLAIARRSRELATNAADQAEADVLVGRIYDQLGDAELALEPLAAATEGFKALRMRRREGIARLFAASAHANLGELEAAETLLAEALPLLRSTGDAPGLATALRNLAELDAWRGRHAAALERFAEALPLVRRQTMRFLDADDHDESLAVTRFGAQVEPVAQLHQIEASRERLPRDEPIYGWLPDELLGYLLHSTVAGEPDWASALAGFGVRLEALGEPYAAERELVAALIALTRSEPAPTVNNEYYARLVAAWRNGSSSGARRGSATTRSSSTRTTRSAAILGDAAQAREWAQRLRGDVRGASSSVTCTSWGCSGPCWTCSADV